MSSNLDLRKHMDSEAVANAFGKLVSGKSHYKTVIERRVEKVYCPNPNCRKQLEGGEKFCPECGTKIIKAGQLLVQQPQLQSSQNQTENQKENQQTQQTLNQTDEN